MSEIRCGCGLTELESLAREQHMNSGVWLRCALAHAVKDAESWAQQADDRATEAHEYLTRAERAEAALRQMILSHGCFSAVCDSCGPALDVLNSSPPPAPSPAGPKGAEETVGDGAAAGEGAVEDAVEAATERALAAKDRHDCVVLVNAVRSLLAAFIARSEHRGIVACIYCGGIWELGLHQRHKSNCLLEAASKACRAVPVEDKP